MASENANDRVPQHGGSASENTTPPPPPVRRGAQRSRYQRPGVKPGDTITGTVVVTEGGRSRSLEVLSGHLHKGKLEAGMSFPFELTLPAEALPEVRSRNGQLYWQVDVKSHEFGRDSHERRRIVVDT